MMGAATQLPVSFSRRAARASSEASVPEASDGAEEYEVLPAGAAGAPDSCSSSRALAT